MPTNLTRRQALAIPAGLALGSLVGRPAVAAEPVKIGLVAALSGPSAKSGEGITRGLTIAIDEINARGGVLGGRMLELVRRDDELNPAKGQTAARELIDKEGVAILFGGIDSPVSLAIVPLVNTAQVPFMGVWAAATNITRNGANPNYVFPGLGRRRAGRSRADQARDDGLRFESPGADARQQWLGRVQPWRLDRGRGSGGYQARGRGKI